MLALEVMEFRYIYKIHSMNEIGIDVVCLILGYLIGSILFAHLITKIISGKNIRDLGNHNPGAYNVYAQVSKFWGVMSGILDAVKAIVPMLIAHYFFGISNIALACLGIGAVIGHHYPLYYHFKGGRSASTLLGMFLYFIPIELGVASVVDAILVFGFIRKRYAVWGPSILIALSLVLCLFFHHPIEIKLMVWVGGLIVLWFNRDGLQNLFIKPGVKEKLSQQS